MTQTTVPTKPISLETVRSLEGVLRENSGQGEVDRRMSEASMEALIDSGALRMWMPSEFGGAEMEPNASLDVMEAFARIDPAAGWIVSNCVFISIMGQFLPPHVVAKILSDPKAVTCGSFVPPGLAQPTSGGYSVTGNWSFGSASHYATSLVVLTLLANADGPIFDSTGAPTSVVSFLTPTDVELLDAWNTLGLRATGSTNFTAASVFVPVEHTYLLGPWDPPAGAFSGPLYRMGVIMDAVRIARVGVGIAAGALDEFVALANTKTPAYTAALTADRATVQERVARAQALIDAGRNTLRATVAEAWAAVQKGPRITGPGSIPMGLASAFALDASVQAVELLYESAGSTAFRDESPLQKRFRDIQTLRQNAITSWSRYEGLGKMISWAAKAIGHSTTFKRCSRRPLSSGSLPSAHTRTPASSRCVR